MTGGWRLAIAALVPLAASAGELRLAERGRPGEYVIAVADGGGAAAWQAAEELQRYVERMTGVRLRVGNDAGAARAIVIESGAGADDGFTLRVCGKRLRVIGHGGEGARFGVYELLERFGGCGWFTPECEVVPRRESFEVPDDLDVDETPAFRERIVYNEAARGSPEFALHCRAASVCKFDPVLGKCHTFAALLPPDEYFDAHPEYFSEVNGHRRKVYSQLCLTNPEVVRLCTEKVLARIAESYKDGVRYYGVSQNDWNGWCTCANCRALDEREGSPSGSLVAFVNEIAERVEREYPDVFIETLVYTYTRHPPKTLKFRQNVVPCFCTIECDFSKPIATSRADENRSVREAIREWGWKSRQMMVWDYSSDYFSYLQTWPNVRSLGPNLRLFREAGATMVMELGGARHADWEELKTWLMFKLMWNPHRDVPTLLNRYFAAVFGPAAPEMRAYFELIHSQYRDEAALPMRCFDLPERCTITPDVLRRAAKIVGWAEAKVSSPGLEQYATNVANARLSLDYTRAVKGYGRFRLRRGAQVIDREEFRSQQAGARRVLASGAALSQGNDPLSGVFLERLVKSDADAASSPCPRIFIGAKSLWRGGIGDRAAEFVEDAEAADGVALKLKNRTCGMLGHFSFAMVDFEPGAKVRLRIRVKVMKTRAEAARRDLGEAFSAGVWSAKTARPCMKMVSRRLAEVTDGVYEWHELGEWIPGEREHFWIAPGRFNPGENRGNFEAVLIDGLELGIAE